MIRISSEQSDKLSQSDHDRFVDQVVAHVLTECPSRLPLPALRQMVESGLERARGHGLHTTAQLVAFVTLMFSFSPNFDHQRDIRKLLDEKTPSIDERWELLFTPEYDAAWEAAGEPGFYDETEWFPGSKDEMH